ncbi:unnamed protein product [Anisakis simplex]|uniref:Probable cubilin (inferred by orthology to a C. elegans protein) n=1 Tax=Anisakis simplex TaxID=6269 RepID=A0A0M3K4D8_ANISI|nr:unnamed protein product [Anisakis simplex]
MGRKLRGLLSAVKAHLVLLDARLKKNECAGKPCQNGGTCIDLYKKFMCICPSAFEGTTCENRVDECALYEGTHAGCQNNGTCVNKATGFQLFDACVRIFRCICPKGYHGSRCGLRVTACEFSFDLCGPAGHCIPAPPVNDSGEPGYRCICEWGYRSTADKANPTCEDIDECESNPCYPGATCVNLPGSFKCSGCPAGMTGNGVNCFDIDECADTELVTCSKDPPVQCINTIGSFTCAACPPDGRYHKGAFQGYKGDGRICTKLDPCETAPCYPGAKCFNMGSASLTEGGYRCECPQGMIGDGIGREGCYRSNATLCSIDTCYNQGTCQVVSEDEYKCHCNWGYVGKRCEFATACLENICGGRGECIPKADASFECKCMKGYYGNTCQFEEDGSILHLLTIALIRGCGGHSTNSSGKIKYPDWTWYHFGRNKSCEWIITVDEPNKAKCGERQYGNEGEISLYDYQKSETCQWHVSVDPSRHIEVTIEPFNLGSKQIRNCSLNSLELFDGLEVDESARILHLCNSEETRTLVRTTLPYFTAYFRSDFPSDFPTDECNEDAKCRRGFTIKYRTIELDKDCGGNILPDADGNFDGVIQSPNYGFNYFPNLDCLWSLDASTTSNRPDDGHVIRAEVIDMDIPSSPPSGIKGDQSCSIK